MRFDMRSGNMEGFTLMELLIAGALFSIVTLVSLSSFFFFTNIQRSQIRRQDMLGQGNYMVEYISRAVRMAQNSSGECGVPSGQFLDASDGLLEFKNSDGTCQKFELSGARVWETKGGVTTALSSEEVQISGFPAQGFGLLPDDSQQPRVAFGFTMVAEDGEPVYLQTTVSQRNLDIPGT